MSTKVKRKDLVESIYSLDDFDYNSVKHLPIQKECLACHKPFYGVGRNGSRQQYCNRTHFINCVMCGKPVKQVPVTTKPESIRLTCSKECSEKFRLQQSKSAVMDKYGCENISQVPEFKDKISAGIKAKSSQTTAKAAKTLNDRYGGSGTASPVIRAKIEATMQSKYGVTNPTELSEVRDKIRNKLNSEESKNKRKSTNREIYGFDYATQNEEVKKRMEATLLQNHGVKYAGQIAESRIKCAKTCLERYGVKCSLQTDYAISKCREGFISHIHSNNKVSKLNQEVALALQNSADVRTDFEKIVDRSWYDIEVEGTNILIEVDPSYTHPDLPNHWSPNHGLDPNYHLNKTLKAIENGYRCIHIFDWDSIDKIAMLLCKKTKIFARNCKLVNLDEKTASNFVERYHIQGRTRGTEYAYGLEYNDQLVSVMTFGKPRYNKHYRWELLRLCTDSNYIVTGGASKMFKAFLKEANPESIISYCDRSKFTGEVYTRIGMKISHSSEPAKVWSKGDRYVTDNLLRQRGYDQLFGTSYGKGTSNEELMIANGWRSVYDCGQLVFEWRCCK